MPNHEDAELIGRLCKLEQFSERLESDLKREIEIEFADHIAAIGELNPLIEEQAFHEAFIEQRTQIHVPRRDVEQAITDYVGGDDPRPLVLSGPSGSGKSSLLAHWVKAHQEERELDCTTATGDAPPWLVARFIGASPASTNLRQLLGNLCEEISRQFELTDFDLPTAIENPIVKRLNEFTSKMRSLREASGDAASTSATNDSAKGPADMKEVIGSELADMMVDFQNLFTEMIGENQTNAPEPDPAGRESVTNLAIALAALTEGKQSARPQGTASPQQPGEEANHDVQDVVPSPGKNVHDLIAEVPPRRSGHTCSKLSRKKGRWCWCWMASINWMTPPAHFGSIGCCRICLQAFE